MLSDVLRPLAHFEGTRAHAAPQDRRQAIVEAAARFREEMLAGPRVAYYRSFDLVRVPYPTRYGLRDACTAATPFIHILNRMFIIKFKTPEGLKTLLVSPSDLDGNRETPFFKRLASRYGETLSGWLAPKLSTVEQCLARAGVRPEEVDFLTYDHLHTQDVRRWLGAGGLFPRAKLLVMRDEWEAARALLPPQRDWYCPGGIDGLDPSRVVLLDGDTLLGDSVALIRTPGHTMGNHSIVAHTPEGLLVTSENGVGPDAYAPRSSRLPGVRRWARETGMDVILNGNTLEGALDQYLSMVQEREIAGPSPRAEGFYNVVTSSELTGFWLFPGVTPTFAFGELEFGAP